MIQTNLHMNDHFEVFILGAGFKVVTFFSVFVETKDAFNYFSLELRRDDDYSFDSWNLEDEDVSFLFFIVWRELFGIGTSNFEL